ncbi:MAG: glucosaminidase domain-containing protein [Spirochaetota bacterium]
MSGIDRRTGRGARAYAGRVVRLVLIVALGGLWFDGHPVHAEASDGPGVEGDILLAAVRDVGFAEVRAHVRRKNPAIDEIYLRTLHRHYLELCRLEGVNMAVAIAQMIHETDYLRFTGSVRAVQYNYAGLGATGGDNPGLSFPDMRTGVAAHVQHIKAYANDVALVTPLVDPRFHLVRRGSAPTVRSLTGRWATDPEYGEKLVAHLAAMLSQPPEVGAPAADR